MNITFQSIVYFISIVQSLQSELVLHSVHNVVVISVLQRQNVEQCNMFLQCSFNRMLFFW